MASTKPLAEVFIDGDEIVDEIAGRRLAVTFPAISPTAR